MATKSAPNRRSQDGVELEVLNAGLPRLPLQPMSEDDKRELAEVISAMNAAVEKEIK